MEPFILKPAVDTEVALVARRLHMQHQQAAPASGAGLEQGLDSSTNAGVSGGVLRLSEFLKRYHGKPPKANPSRQRHLVLRYETLFSKVEELDGKGLRFNLEL